MRELAAQPRQLLLDVWDLAASRSIHGALVYARGVAVIHAVLAVAGLIPGPPTMFGLAPLFGHDVWLHDALAAQLGFVQRDRGEVSSIRHRRAS